MAVSVASKSSRSSVRTQADLALLAGVSQVAVHKALKGSGDVSPELRRRVLRLAQRHGYRLNASARGLATGSCASIGLLFAQAAGLGMLPAGLLSGIAAELGVRNLGLSIAQGPSAPDTAVEQWPKLLRERLVDGLLLDAQCMVSPNVAKYLRSQGMPLVWLRAREAFNAVYADEFAGSRMAVRHLMELGHRRIAFLDHGWDGQHWDIDRREGYLAAMKDAGLSARHIRLGDQPHLPALDSYDEEGKALGAILRASDRPTAIMAANRWEALRVYSVATELQVHIPEELSLIGFSDFRIFEGMPITTMQSSMTELGHMAVKMMVERIEQPDEELASRFLRLNLVEGRSVAAAKQDRHAF